jgi:hypothetical protein
MIHVGVFFWHYFLHIIAVSRAEPYAQGFESRQTKDLSAVSRPAFHPTRSWCDSWRVKELEREADQSLSSSSAVKDSGAIHPHPHSRNGTDINQTKRQLCPLIPIYYSQTRRTQYCVRSAVFTAVTMKNVVCWDVTPCGSYNNRRFGGSYHPPSCDKNLRTNNVRSVLRLLIC